MITWAITIKFAHGEIRYTRATDLGVRQILKEVGELVLRLETESLLPEMGSSESVKVCRA